MIRPLEKKDLPDVLRIYQLGMETGIATFETNVPTAEQWDKGHHAVLRYVFEEDAKVLGWITILPISSRQAYQGVGEVSIYIEPSAQGKGIGAALLHHLMEQAKQQGYWMLQSSIFEVNEASIQLHQKAGFRLIGTRKCIAKRDGQWMNTILMEKHLELIM